MGPVFIARYQADNGVLQTTPKPTPIAAFRALRSLLGSWRGNRWELEVFTTTGQPVWPLLDGEPVETRAAKDWAAYELANMPRLPEGWKWALIEYGTRDLSLPVRWSARKGEGIVVWPDGARFGDDPDLAKVVKIVTAVDRGTDPAPPSKEAVQIARLERRLLKARAGREKLRALTSPVPPPNGWKWDGLTLVHSSDSSRRAWKENGRLAFREGDMIGDNLSARMLAAITAEKQRQEALGCQPAQELRREFEQKFERQRQRHGTLLEGMHQRVRSIESWAERLAHILWPPGPIPVRSTLDDIEREVKRLVDNQQTREAGEIVDRVDSKIDEAADLGENQLRPRLIYPDARKRYPIIAALNANRDEVHRQGHALLRLRKLLGTTSRSHGLDDVVQAVHRLVKEVANAKEAIGAAADESLACALSRLRCDLGCRSDESITVRLKARTVGLEQQADKLLGGTGTLVERVEAVRSAIGCEGNETAIDRATQIESLPATPATARIGDSVMPKPYGCFGIVVDITPETMRVCMPWGNVVDAIAGKWGSPRHHPKAVIVIDGVEHELCAMSDEAPHAVVGGLRYRVRA